MTRPGYAEPHVDLGDVATPQLVRRLGRAPRAVRNYFTKTWALVAMEGQKLRHDPTELLTRAVQPVLWLVIFGEVVTAARAFDTGNIPYINFITPGILAQSVLFVAIFYGIAAIWERDLGILQKFMATPTPRTALVLGKALSAGLRGLSQMVMIYAVAVALGVSMNWNPLALLGVVFIVLLGATIFATLSLIIASFVKTRDRFMGIGQLLTMPLFFASNAIYPIANMPDWLRAIAAVNPLSYMADALRSLMIVPGLSIYGLPLDLGVLGAFAVVLVLIGGHYYAKLVL